jgi:hypothetical protein
MLYLKKFNFLFTWTEPFIVYCYRCFRVCLFLRLILPATSHLLVKFDFTCWLRSDSLPKFDCLWLHSNSFLNLILFVDPALTHSLNLTCCDFIITRSLNPILFAHSLNLSLLVNSLWVTQQIWFLLVDFTLTQSLNLSVLVISLWVTH